MLLSYHDLVKLVNDGVINANPQYINGASIDIHLGHEVALESPTLIGELPYVDLMTKQLPAMTVFKMQEERGIALSPGAFALATSVETFNLPDDIACKFFLRSSVARAGLNALLAMWCLTGDTRIPLLDGSVRRIDELVGQQTWLYAVSEDGRTVPGFASRIWQTREIEELAFVQFDDGQVIQCTPDHLWRSRSGDWIAAQDLRPDQPMMAIERRPGAYNGVYEMVYSPNPAGFRRRWIPTHRMIDQELRGSLPNDQVVHHVDHNPLNNHPDNLVRLSRRDHVQHHHETLSPERRAALSQFRSEKIKRQNAERWANPEARHIHSAWAKTHAVTQSMQTFIREHKEVWHQKFLLGMIRKALATLIDQQLPVTPANYLAFKRQNAPTLGTLESVFGSFEQAIEAAEYRNHRVVAVQIHRLPAPMPVYDLTVDRHHSFVLENGVVSSNCDPGWSNSQLTLELHNVLQHHHIIIKPNLRIGQMVFYRCQPVPKERSYQTVGRYNHQQGVQMSKGV